MKRDWGIRRPASRFIIALVCGLALLTWAASLLVYRTTRDWFEKDVSLRAELAVNGARQSLLSHWKAEGRTDLHALLADLNRDERILAAACGKDLSTLASTANFPEQLGCRRVGAHVRQSGPSGVVFVPWKVITSLPGGTVHVSAIPLFDQQAALQQFLDLPEVYYVGLHGLEVRVPRGRTEVTEEVASVRAILPEIRGEIEKSLARRPGMLIEDKGTALACRYRLASQATARLARDTLATVVEVYRRKGIPIRLTHGHQVTEIRPASANKGKTVCRLLAAYDSSALAVYIGDDQTDEDAFALLPAGSITIRVGPGTSLTAARYWLENPGRVQRFLAVVLEQRRHRPA